MIIAKPITTSAISKTGRCIPNNKPITCKNANAAAATGKYFRLVTEQSFFIVVYFL
jgi:hypothetical protein